MRFRCLFAFAIGIALCATMVTAAAVPHPAPMIMDVSFFQAKALNASLSSAPYVPKREHYDTDEEFIMSYIDWEEWYDHEQGSGDDSSSSSSADWDDEWDDNHPLLQPREWDYSKHVNMSEYYHLPPPRPKPANMEPMAAQYPYYTPTKCFGGTVDEAERKVARKKFADRILRNSRSIRGASFERERIWRELSGTVMFYACACRPSAAIDYDWYISMEDLDRMEEFEVQDCGTQVGRAYNIEKQIKIGVALTIPWWDNRRLCNQYCIEFSHQGRHLNAEFADRYKKAMVESGPEEGYQWTGHISLDDQ